MSIRDRLVDALSDSGKPNRTNENPIHNFWMGIMIQISSSLIDVRLLGAFVKQAGFNFGKSPIRELTFGNLAHF
jgi:hypothetical protein